MAKTATLKLPDISPELAKTRSSIISMPGLQEVQGEHNSASIVTIHSFETLVAILPSKTKPKKIRLIGSDGQKYTYLLKGREDLVKYYDSNFAILIPLFIC